MSLYIRIGVLTMLAIGLSVLLLNYTLSTKEMDNNFSEVSKGLRELDLADENVKIFDNLSESTGSQIKSFIEDSHSHGLAIFLIGRAGSVINYGTQLRVGGEQTDQINPSFVSGEIQNRFERSYVTTVRHFITSRSSGNQTGSLNYQFAGIDNTLTSVTYPTQASLANQDSKSFTVQTSQGGSKDGSYLDRNRLFTSQELVRGDVNTNTSIMNNVGGYYYVEDNDTFISVVVEGYNGEVVGVVFEPADIEDRYSVVRRLFKER